MTPPKTRHQLVKVPCFICTQETDALIPLEDDPPEGRICPFCAPAIGILHREPEVEWVKILGVVLPAGMTAYAPLRSSDEELIAKLAASGLSHNHGALVRPSELEVVSKEQEDGSHDQYMKGSGRELLREGLPGFAVTREVLRLPQVRDVLDKLPLS